jgi:hypothetical protein
MRHKRRRPIGRKPYFCLFVTPYEKRNIVPKVFLMHEEFPAIT